MSPRPVSLIIAAILVIGSGIFSLLAEQVAASSDNSTAVAIEDLTFKVDMLTQQVSSLVEKSDQEEYEMWAYKKTVQSLVEGQNSMSNSFAKIFSINHLKYDMSTIDNAQFYIASKEAQNFDLEEMNKLCHESNGFLAEVNDENELKILKDFVKDIGPNIYAIGGNDVDTEGQFVYYNSKTPMPENLWKSGEPSNIGGNENCVAVTPLGLNDFRCDIVAKYICEISMLS